MSTHSVSLTVNGEARTIEVEPRRLLVHCLRDDLGLTGTHVGCDTSNCGACTVHLDGQAVKCCTVLAVQADGAEVTTIEGMGTEARPASRAGGVLGEARPAVRLLHPGHDHGRGRPAARATRTRPRTRSATRWRATSAAAPATTTSSRRCSSGRRSARGRSAIEPADARRRLRMSAQTSWVGRALKRKEDPRAHHGPRPTYVDDIALPGTLYAAFVRSPEAHARIVSIDTSAARGARRRRARCSPART